MLKHTTMTLADYYNIYVPFVVAKLVLVVDGRLGRQTALTQHLFRDAVRVIVAGRRAQRHVIGGSPARKQTHIYTIKTMIATIQST